MSPAVLCWWNTKQRDLFLKSNFRDESVRLLAPRQSEMIREICWRHRWGECLLSYSEGVWARRLGDLGADDFPLKRDVLRPFAFPGVWCLPGVWWYSCAGTLPNVLVIAKKPLSLKEVYSGSTSEMKCSHKSILRHLYWARNKDTLTGKIVEMWSNFYWAGCSQLSLVFQANVQTYTKCILLKACGKTESSSASSVLRGQQTDSLMRAEFGDVVDRVDTREVNRVEKSISSSQWNGTLLWWKRKTVRIWNPFESSIKEGVPLQQDSSQN